MRILLLSKEGDGLGLAQRMTRNGHEVFVYIKEPRFEKAGRGIVKRVSEWRTLLPRLDLVICDMVGMGHLESLFNRLSKPVISCSTFFDVMELDRAKGMRLFLAAGIDIPETWSFSNVRDAKKLLTRVPWENGFCIKPSGNISTAKTMVLKEEGEFEWGLSYIPRDEPLIIQRVVDGIEVSTEGWFNGEDWVLPFNHTFEEKRLFNDNLGPNTGCMGNVVLAVEGRGNRLVASTVGKLTKVLRHVKYRGPVDVNCIVDENKARALEITSRLGYDAIEALVSGLEDDVGETLLGVANGSLRRMKINPSNSMMAVRLSVPPWPSRKPGKDEEGEPVFGIDEETLDEIFITDLYKDEEGYKTAAGDGVLLKAASVGEIRGDDYVGEASKKVYKTLEKIKVHGRQYRTDIGKRVNKEVKQLKSWGWLE